METNNNNTIESKNVSENSVKDILITKSSSDPHRAAIYCNIRRRPNMTALPGQDPNERQYIVGASLDIRTKANLKGISGELEQLLMPEIIGRSINDPLFRTAIDEYWSSISKPVPSDEVFQQEHQKGVPLNIQFTIIGKARLEAFNKAETIEDKVAFLNKMLVEKVDSETYKATLDFESVSDYLLLNYCLRYSRVANSIENVDKSPKICFYLYEKSSSVKLQLNIIEARAKAVQLYTAVCQDENRLDAVLLSFGEDLKQHRDIFDKQIKLDSIYNESKDNLYNFIKYAEDSSWDTKYLINLSIAKQRLTRKPNSTAIYYNDSLIGIDMQSAVEFLLSDKGKQIKESLDQEVSV